MRRLSLILIPIILASAPAQGQAPGARWFSVPDTATFQTGDSWMEGGTRFRLYGVQSCLRGTSFTNARGVKRDCGEASLAMLIALIRDLRPQCYTTTELAQPQTRYVICVATRSEGVGKGSRIDLGTALIATGFAFAALNPDGYPVHAPYRVAQDLARRSCEGLWAYPDLPEPNAIIRQAMQAAGSPADPPSPR